MFCETFTQWVIEDRFVAGRPEWEKVGAQFVDDVAPYEMMKLRLLNGSHLAIAGLGRLAGYTYIHEAMANPLLPRFMAALMERETRADAAAGAGHRPRAIPAHADRALRQPGDPRHRRARQHRCAAQRAGRADRAPGSRRTRRSTCWRCRSPPGCGAVRGEDEQGEPIDVRHPLAAMLRERAEEGGSDPGPLLGIRPLFGGMGADPRLSGPVGKWLASLYEVGSLRTLERAAAELGF